MKTDKVGPEALDPGADPEAPTLAEQPDDVSFLLSLQGTMDEAEAEAQTASRPGAGARGAGMAYGGVPGAVHAAPSPGEEAQASLAKELQVHVARRGAAASASAPSRIEPGGKLGHYLLLDQIGAGGMAIIYRAKDLRTGRVVAVKALHARQAKTLAGKRFRREYRAIRRLEHPNIVQVYEYGVENDQPYIAMEYVDGEDLKTYLRKLWKLPASEQWPRIERILIQICLALEEVHGRGIIHRDLKPSNILLTREHEVKLTDFGVAKPEEVSVQLTQAGMLVGTVAYLAPEVFEQAPLDHRIDLYALGVMLYVMLAHKLPFSGKNIAELMQKHLTVTPRPPSELNPDVPPHLETITLRLLAKNPAHRYQSAAAVLRALRAGRSETNLAERFQPRERDLYWVPRLVGRSDELKTILDRVTRLMAGEGGVLVVEGPEGTGKSRLVETGLAVAQPRGIGVYTGACLEGGQAWGEGLREIVETLATEADRTHESHPALERLKRLVAQDEGPVPVQAARRGRPELADDFVQLLTSLAGKSPRIISVDDIHWADRGTATALEALARRLGAGGPPILLVLTTEVPPSELPPPMAQVTGGGLPGVPVTRLRLAGLHYNDIVDLLEFMYPSDSRVGALGKRLYEQTRGNALLLADILRLLLIRGKLGRRPEHGKWRWTMSLSTDDIAGRFKIPPSLEAIVAERLRAYPPQTGTLLRLIAIWGRPVSFQALLQVTGASESALLAHVERLLLDGWLAEEWHGTQERYRLGHPAYRRLLLSQLSEKARSQYRAFIASRWQPSAQLEEDGVEGAEGDREA